MGQPDSSGDAYQVALTRLLNEGAGGEGAATLLPMVYDQLRRLASSRMRQQSPEHTLQATALVHEAYLRLVQGQGSQQWKNQQHFFAAAAEAMRCILVDSARRNNRLKHGGGACADRQRVSFDELG